MSTPNNPLAAACEETKRARDEAWETYVAAGRAAGAAHGTYDLAKRAMDEARATWDKARRVHNGVYHAEGIKEVWDTYQRAMGAQQ